MRSNNKENEANPGYRLQTAWFLQLPEFNLGAVLDQLLGLVLMS